jgi:hypothetical protein
MAFDQAPCQQYRDCGYSRKEDSRWSSQACAKRIASPKSNPRVRSIDSSQDSIVDLSRKLLRGMVPESLPLAIRP